jgi:hypothetical protein
MTRDELIKNFVEARAAFLKRNRHDLETYITGLKRCSADAALAKLGEQVDLETVPNRHKAECQKFHAYQAVAHINLDDLPPRFFIDEPYFAQRKPTKTRTAVIEAAKAFLGLAGGT